MIRHRVMPTLLISGDSLVKTKNFKAPVYVGDPANTVRIFNELEVDELILLDIDAYRHRGSPNISLLKEVANECFMPLAYGGGIVNADQAQTIFNIGYEKIILNSGAINRIDLITEIASVYGSQAVVASIDYKRDFWGRCRVYSRGATKNSGLGVLEWALAVEKAGAGEILLTSVEREGCWSGFDVEVIEEVAKAVSVPVIAHGGAGCWEHIRDAILRARASAAAIGSMVVFQKKGMGVLISFPSTEKLAELEVETKDITLKTKSPQ